MDFHIAPFWKGNWRSYAVVGGLINPTITAINQNWDGLMWFGSQEGLTKYDGKNFSYLLDGLTGMQVKQIYRDQSDNMWVSTRGGVTKFEKESARRKVSVSR